MKIVGICGSQKALSKTSHSELLLKAIGVRVEEGGRSFNLIRLLNFNIKECDACDICVKTGKCKHTGNKDDRFDDIVNALQAADGFVFCSPVYGEGIPAIFINFLNRCWALKNTGENRNPFEGKPVLIIAGSGGVGNASALYEFENYRHYLGYRACGFLGLGLLNSDSEMAGMTGFVDPYNSKGIMGLVNNSMDKLIKTLEMESLL